MASIAGSQRSMRASSIFVGAVGSAAQATLINNATPATDHFLMGPPRQLLETMTLVGSAAAGAVPVWVFAISNDPFARRSADDAPTQKSMRPASTSHWPRGLQKANCSGVR